MTERLQVEREAGWETERSGERRSLDGRDHLAGGNEGLPGEAEVFDVGMDWKSCRDG